LEYVWLPLRLVIGNKNYSSWSMRAWVLMRTFGFDFEEVLIRLREPDSIERKLAFSPAGKVPVLIDGDLRVWDTMAIFEYLNERAPDKHLWPEDHTARAVARSVSAEMHSGFSHLKDAMPFNCRRRTSVGGLPSAVQGDINRICEIFRDARSRFGGNGPFLFGPFSVADAMFAPVSQPLSDLRDPA
jgi:glutathione S-transferase